MSRRAVAGAAGAALAAALGALTACGANTGTVDVSLVVAPGSTVMDAVQTLELTLTDPLQTVTATRDAGSFSLSLSVDATSTSGMLIIRGNDDTGALVATGSSPPFPIDAVTASFSVFMAAPNSVAASPAVLDPPRSELATGVLSYGILFAGGRDAASAPSDATAIYDAYDHTVTANTALPSPRAGVAMGIEAQAYAYVYGGTDASGSAQANDWVLDTTESPGAFADFGTKTGFERAGEALLDVDDNELLLTGAPAALLSATSGVLATRSDVASLPPAGVVTTGADGATAALFVDGSGVTRYRDAANAFDTLQVGVGIARDGATPAALPNGLVGIFCGGSDAATVDIVTGAATTVSAIPSDDRASGCAVATTDRFVVIAGGTLASGGVATTAEIYDATTLAPVATTPLVVPRTDATAIALPNGQVMIVGGEDANGAPIGTIELFTPAPDPKFAPTS